MSLFPMLGLQICTPVFGLLNESWESALVIAYVTVIKYHCGSLLIDHWPFVCEGEGAEVSE